MTLARPVTVQGMSEKTSALDNRTEQRRASLLDRVLRDLAGLLERVDSGDVTKPTPCTDYSVAKLRQHVVGWLTAFTDGYSSDDGLCSDPDAVTVSGTGSEQVREAASRLGSALDNGAMERPLKIGESDMPGEMALRMILWEYQVHGWDLAMATGQPWQPDEAALRDSLEFAPGMLSPDFQGEGKAFGPQVDVPEAAPALDRLVALSGRDPNWHGDSTA